MKKSISSGVLGIIAVIASVTAITVYVASTQPSPNIVVVMVDDLDYGLSRRLYSLGYLPKIKSAFGNQIIFSESYVTTALCCPSRATFLTGQYSHNNGVLGNEPPNGGVQWLDDSSTIATWLHDKGYLVGHVGKYLNGYGTGGQGALDPGYIPPGYDWWAGLTADPTVMYGFTLNKNGTLNTYGASPGDYQTDVLSGLAVEFLNMAESDDDRPFFLIVTPTAPHVEHSGPKTPGCSGPFANTIRPASRHDGLFSTLAVPRPPSFNEGNVSDKPPTISALRLMTNMDIACNESLYRDRAESMLAVDDLVGNLVDNLALLSENETMIVFTSDNGWFYGEHRLTQKIIGYREALQVPLLISHPGNTSRKIVSELVLNNDLAATFVDVAGASSPQLDGRSLMPLIHGTGGQWRDVFLFEYNGNASRWPNLTHFRGVMGSDFSYVEWDDGAIEYYDLLFDPYQQRSLHNESSYAASIQAAHDMLVNLESCAGQTCVSGEGP